MLTRLAPIALALLALTGGCSAETASPPAPVATAGPLEDSDGPRGPVVGRVGARSITIGELDDWLKDEFFERQLGSDAPRLFAERSRALDAIVDTLVLEALAREAGSPPDALLAQEIAALGPVSDEEVTAFFEEHKARMQPDAKLETLTPQIRSFLERERRGEVLMALREKLDVEILFEPPRAEVAATGPSLGPEDATVTIVEFSDYQCPFCQRAEPVVKEVMARYPEQVRVVYRHLPLDSIHPRARVAAEASVCAEAQGRFWDYHALLFTNRQALSDEDLARYAEELGLDTDAFAACREGTVAKERVDSDVEAARVAGASGTPAFFINGIHLTGAKPVEEFVRIIESELARSEDSSS